MVRPRQKTIEIDTPSQYGSVYPGEQFPEVFPDQTQRHCYEEEMDCKGGQAAQSSQELDLESSALK